jgi:DNA-binding transcriptional regulator YiaG
MTTIHTLLGIASSVLPDPRLPSPELRRAIRQQAGVSSTTLAASLGVSVRTLERWESGLTKPNPASALQYSAVLAHLGMEVRDEC